MSIVTSYIGSYADNAGIYKVDFDMITGRFSNVNLCYKAAQTKALVCERGSLISTISIDPKAGLVLLDVNQPKIYICDSKYHEKVSSCSIFRDRNMLYTANYHEGTFYIYDISHGSLNLHKRIKVDDYAKCHQVFTYEHFLFVVCLGLDKIKIYDIDQDYVFSKDIDFPKGSGPRHAIINQKNHYMYVVTEYSNEVFVYEMKAHLSFFCAQIIKTLPSGVKGENSSAAICLGKYGKHLYTTTRGSNIITSFDIIKGCLRRSQFVESGGDHPRDMTLDPSGNYLLVSNRYTNNIIVYRINRIGEIIEQCDELTMEEPAAIVFKK